MPPTTPTQPSTSGTPSKEPNYTMTNHAQFSLCLDKAAVDACRVAEWSNLFHAKKHQLKRKIIELPSTFIDYLHTDGIMLPKPLNRNVLHFDDPRSSRKEEEDDEDDNESWCDAAEVDVSQLASMANIDLSDDSDSEPELENVGLADIAFHDLEKDIENAIEDLGGDVVPKLNWSVPLDATWLKGSLKCSNAGDVFLLLKGSDFVQHDLTHAYDYCSDGKSEELTNFKLTLTKWCNFYESMEMRCIVYDNQLVAVCQRNCRTVFKGLKEEYEKVEQQAPGNLLDLIQAFFEENIVGEFQLMHYTFDVYVDKKRRVWLMDFGPLATLTQESFEQGSVKRECSDRLLETPPHHLYSWEDLAMFVNDGANSDPEFRIVKTEADAYGNILGMHKVPVELVKGEMSSEFVAESLAKLDQLSKAN